MTYNLHPIFVHFPIAFLFVYSVIKIIPFSRWFPRVAWKDIERILLLVGVLGAFAALATGETAEHFARSNHKLVESHAFFATLATWLYGALLLGEISAFLRERFLLIIKRYSWLESFLAVLEKVLCNRVISILIAIIAIFSITLAGLLGGVLVYGTTADPFAGIVLDMLGITL